LTSPLASFFTSAATSPLTFVDGDPRRFFQLSGTFTFSAEGASEHVASGGEGRRSEHRKRDDRSHAKHTNHAEGSNKA
jgi:hypothetical protein